MMNELKECIDLQVEFNQSKNLFHKEFNETIRFTESIINAVEKADRITSNDLKILIEYAIEKVLQEFCRVNQYFLFQEKDRISLIKLYWNLYHDLVNKKAPMNIISKTHYENMKLWLEETNPFSQEVYRKKGTILEAVACSEYSALLQKEILHLNKVQLLEPVLDIGCGKTGNLVKDLRKEGFDAYGIDRFSDDLFFLKKEDWLKFDYGVEKWGTIVSNLGFSNHFVHNHLREDGHFEDYAKKYMDILRALKIGGCFCYAPDLPFIEKYLDKNSFLIMNYNVENLPFRTTIIKRLG